MRSPVLVIVQALALAFAACPLEAQARRLTYGPPEIVINFKKEGVRKGMLAMSPSGRFIMGTETYQGELRAFDSTGRSLGWHVLIGRDPKSVAAWVTGMGFIGRDTTWVMDGLYRQIALLDSNGALVKSLEVPGWIRPFWGERHKYPFFSRSSVEAVYADHSMLVRPEQPRALFDTPDFDRAAPHLMRVDADGKILKDVLALSRMQGRLALRDGAKWRYVNVPFFARTFWKVSSDGERVAVLTPLITFRDSGAFNVTQLTRDGDTVFSRRHQFPAKRVPVELVNQALGREQAFGTKYTAQWIRDTARKLVPVFESPIYNLNVGLDHSTWVWFRVPNQKTGDHTAMVIDAKGEVVGIATISPNLRPQHFTADDIWAVATLDPKQGPVLVRLRRSAFATAARPSRSESASASRARSKRSK